MATCFMQSNPNSGFVSQHTSNCAVIQNHLDGVIRVNGYSTHHVQYGVSKDHPNGSGCLNVCGLCANKYRKLSDCQVTEGAIIL